MVRFLVATHGFLADGFKSTMSVLMGQEIADRIETINAYANDDMRSPKVLLDDFVKTIGKNELIIFTDVMFGSVNQFAMPYANNNIFILTGVNFPLMLEFVARYSFDENAKVEPDFIRDVIKKAQNQIIYVNDEINKENKEEKEENFFD